MNNIKKNYSEITPEIQALSERAMSGIIIDKDLYEKYDVKRGLRDINGKGVMAGLTDISDVRQNKIVDGVEVPTDGRLFYRGYDVKDLVLGVKDGRFGFEEASYLLLFGDLPNAKELADFSALLSDYRSLPPSFVRDVIMKAPSPDMMNSLARGVLTLYSYDENPDDISPENVLRQCLQLVAIFPLLSVYGYQAYRHWTHGESLFIHAPDPNLSTAENILLTLRPDSKYTELEARVLDLALVLHAEHGGGNNSTFTMRVVSSSATDTYSSVAAALGSLKGPRHGGANIKVVQMFEDIKKNISDWTDEDALRQYLTDALDKKAFDKSGLIYGVGHAVYSVSDPRALLFRSFVENLAGEKGITDEFDLYRRVERLGPEIIGEKRKIFKGVSANVDFWSGFAYRLLNLPTELYTPIFAIARMSGWAAHRLEELANNSKIIRPAYKSVCGDREYVPLDKR